jgi:small-conductance mechanosensitive channel
MIKVGLILVLLMSYVFLARTIGATIRRLGKSKQVSQFRINYLDKTAKIALFTLLIFVVCLVLGLGYGDVSFMLSSAFAVIGIAFFAQWSILSIITASVVIFFGFPYRVGDRVKVTDADYDLSGTVEEIGLFHVMIKTESGNTITYPNNLILQKPVIKLGPGTATVPQKLFAPQSKPVYQSLRKKIQSGREGTANQKR